MALQVALADTNVGVPAPEAYARIVQINFSALTDVAAVAVDIYASAAARAAGKSPVAGGVFNAQTPGAFDPDAPVGLRAAAYAWLKTLPAFAGAVDV